MPNSDGNHLHCSGEARYGNFEPKMAQDGPRWWLLQKKTKKKMVSCRCSTQPGFFKACFFLHRNSPNPLGKNGLMFRGGEADATALTAPFLADFVMFWLARREQVPTVSSRFFVVMVRPTKEVNSPY